MSAERTATVVISADGYARCCRELDALRSDARREIGERMAEARQDGDPSDNPALQGLYDEQEQLERRIATLEAQLAVAEIVTPATDGRAGVGSDVQVRDRNGAVFAYELVGPLESDAGKGRVSIKAPVGQALLGQRAGACVEVQTPRGPLTLEILAVDPPTEKAA